MIRRRDLLKSTLLLATAGYARQILAAPPPAASSQFSYAVLKGKARALAGAAYEPSRTLVPDSLQQLDYDQYQAIHFRSDHSLWAAEDLGFRVQFFHMGRGFKEPVRMYEVINGREREIGYRPDSFDFGKSGVDGRKLPADLGYAGFRIQTATNWNSDVAAFLGASYLRAVGGDTRQYGLSARGLAIDTAINGPEEFPRFTAFWFEKPPANARTMTVYALLDTPSATGAYRFVITPGATQTMDVDAAVYPRQQIGRLGIAPLTSMFQCGENDRRLANDWRPEIHDSDGLSMLSGNGEWIWRPIVNPAGVRVSSYMDENPRGFGLLQRDRDFEHYQDDGVFYERRPSLWIEPRGAWGKGAIQLVELPAPNETYDNIVAYWNPAQPVLPGSELLFGYRMYWGTQMPANPPLAHVVATRTGIGGVIGQPRRYYSERFAIDFAGGELATLLAQGKVEPVITASRGEVEITSARPLQSIGGYRAMFDIKPPDDGVDPIDLRLFLRRNGQPLTETWMYQWTPPGPRERRDILALSGADVG